MYREAQNDRIPPIFELKTLFYFQELMLLIWCSDVYMEMDVQYLFLLPIVCILNSIDEKYDRNKIFVLIIFLINGVENTNNR